MTIQSAIGSFLEQTEGNVDLLFAILDVLPSIIEELCVSKTDIVFDLDQQEANHLFETHQTSMD